MDLLALIYDNWRIIMDIAFIVTSFAVVWLGSNFLRRREFEKSEAYAREREAQMERRLTAQDLLLKELSVRLEGTKENLTTIDAKLEWRVGAVEKQADILLRGHLEWDDKP